MAYQDELSIQDGIIYRGTRVLIPTSIRHKYTMLIWEQKDVLEQHEIRCVGQRSTMILNLCDNCRTCQEFKPEQTRQPMQSQPIPKRM